jgi:hypothetical protein
VCCFILKKISVLLNNKLQLQLKFCRNISPKYCVPNRILIRLTCCIIVFSEVQRPCIQVQTSSGKVPWFVKREGAKLSQHDVTNAKGSLTSNTAVCHAYFHFLRRAPQDHTGSFSLCTAQPELEGLPRHRQELTAHIVLACEQFRSQQGNAVFEMNGSRLQLEAGPCREARS